MRHHLSIFTKSQNSVIMLKYFNEFHPVLPKQLLKAHIDQQEFKLKT